MKQPFPPVPRPPRGLILSTPVHLIAFGFGAGLSRKAPGTVGTLAAIPLWLLLSALPLPAYLLLVSALFVLGCVVCGESARLLGVDDYPGFVFDEFIGLLLTCVPLMSLPDRYSASGLLWLIPAFLLFRLFDIAKPWPISVADRRLGGGLGVMLDDALAGIAAAMVLWLLLKI